MEEQDLKASRRRNGLEHIVSPTNSLFCVCIGTALHVGGTYAIQSGAVETCKGRGTSLAHRTHTQYDFTYPRLVFDSNKVRLLGMTAVFPSARNCSSMAVPVSLNGEH